MTAPHSTTEQPSPHPLRGLLVAQFCDAFNDNAWKLIVALLAIQHATAHLAPGADAETVAQTQTAITFVLFTLPLVLFSLVGGTLADRLSKRTVIILLKVVELVLMAAAALMLWLTPSGGIALLIILFANSTQSALFSPSKYGILPELVPHEGLAAANGLLEMWTFAAILTGTAAGGFLLQISGDQLWLAPLTLALLSSIALVAALDIPLVAPARLSGGVGSTIRGAWSAIRSQRLLRLAIAGEIFFWTIASLFAQNVLVYAKAVLHLSDAMSGMPMTVLSVGIGLGAFFVGRLSQHRIEYGLVPLGAAGVFACLGLIGAYTPQTAGTLVLMGLLGIASSFIFIPLNAILQWKSPPDQRGSVISFSNTCVFTGILLGSLTGGSLANAGLSTSSIFLATAAFTAVGTAWAIWLLPDALLRLLLVVLTNTVYRLNIVGHEQVPKSGGALLVPNHVSFVDGFLLIASLDRPVRFVVDQQYTSQPLLKPFMKMLGVIPISAHGGLRVVLRALRDAGAAIDRGELVCLFPEGQITRTGALLPFRRGFERIVKGRTTPIVPVHLDRIWGSVFSFVGGRFLTKWPQRIPFPVTVSFGTPLAAGSPVSEVRRAIQDLSEAAWRLRKPDRAPLHRSAIRAMRRHPFRLAMADLTKPHLSCWQAAVGTVALARQLRPHWRGQQNVGILLPPSVGGALVNLASTVAGHTTVNLNYTVGRAGLEAAVKQASLQTIVTSRLFVEKAKLELPSNVMMVWLDDIAKEIGPFQRLVAMALGLFAPLPWLEQACGATRRPTMDDIVTIIFSSGSTGEPKGVMLSHFSIDSNIEGALQIFHVDGRDRLLGILPFFHSFGYMLLLWLAMIHGTAVVYVPSPLDVVAVGDMTSRYRLTICIATPTFLQLYVRRCTPEQFGSLRVVLTGAEKLPERLAQTYEDRFGIRPLEGYGTTECAPVVSVNCPDFRAAGFYQPASRRGSVGQPLPGVSVRIVDPDTFAPLPAGTSGMLLVKGANVMNGYLNNPELTAEVIRDGWYVTGDIACLDDDGFLFITDRLSRFSKIGGEMVPHGRVEEALHDAANADTMVLAVTGVPDDKKGEQLVVLHLLDETRIAELLEKVAAGGLSNLFIPRRDAWFKVDALPLLGSGKLDLRELKRVAMERAQGHNDG